MGHHSSPDAYRTSGDLQPTDECSGGFIFIAVVYQSHLGLEIVDIVLRALPWFHPNREQMVIVPLDLSSRSELFVDGVGYIIKTPKKFLSE